MKLNEEQTARIKALLTIDGYPEPSDVRLTDGRIIQYSANCDRRDAALGAWGALYEALDVDHDGNPETIEVGVQGIVPDVQVNIVVKPHIFKDAA